MTVSTPVAPDAIEQHGDTIDSLQQHVDDVSPHAWAEASPRFEQQLTDHGIVVVKFWLHITPEEQENCLIAESIADLAANRHDVATRYTHCDVEQVIFGLAAGATAQDIWL